MKNREIIPEQLGANGKQILEEMALHIYRDYLETRWEWEIRLEQTRFITDRTEWNKGERDKCFGRFRKDTKSVELKFINDVFEDLDGVDLCKGRKLTEKCHWTFVFSKEQLRELHSRICH